MPSDAMVAVARRALDRPISEFRAAVQGALAQAERTLALQDADTPARVMRAAAELGPFASGRIDAAGFAKLQEARGALSQPAREALWSAAQTLRAVLVRYDELVQVQVPAGGDLRGAVSGALAALSRAFGAVLLTELVRGGRYVPAEHEQLLEPVAFAAWTRNERRYAPPLIVTVGGAELHAAALAPFLDGNERIVLIVEGPAAPAPLARLVTPGTFVLQTVDGAGLERVAASEGPAVGALMPEGSAVFVHDPALGREPWQRIVIGHLPTQAPAHAIGGASQWQMQQDLQQLADLARTPFAVPTTAGSATPALGATDAVDRLAQWLLGGSGLAGGTP